jgi:hypothetical protein
MDEILALLAFLYIFSFVVGKNKSKETDLKVMTTWRACRYNYMYKLV